METELGIQRQLIAKHPQANLMITYLLRRLPLRLQAPVEPHP